MTLSVLNILKNLNLHPKKVQNYMTVNTKKWCLDTSSLLKSKGKEMKSARQQRHYT